MIETSEITEEIDRNLKFQSANVDCVSQQIALLEQNSNGELSEKVVAYLKNRTLKGATLSAVAYKILLELFIAVTNQDKKQGNEKEFVQYEHFRAIKKQLELTVLNAALIERELAEHGMNSKENVLFVRVGCLHLVDVVRSYYRRLLAELN